MKPRRLLSLPLLQRALDDELQGGGPSIATLKRWAASGVLDAARIHDVLRTGQTPRVRFDLEQARRIILNRWPTQTPQTGPRPLPAAAPSAGTEPEQDASAMAPSPQDSLAHDAARMADELRALNGSVVELGQQLRQLAQGLVEIQRDAADFRAARLVLMRKYDESNAMQLQLIAELKRNRGGPAASDSVLELSRLAAGISRINDRLGRLEAHLPPG